jgi:hypothetical protein
MELDKNIVILPFQKYSVYSINNSATALLYMHVSRDTPIPDEIGTRQLVDFYCCVSLLKMIRTVSYRLYSVMRYTRMW